MRLRADILWAAQRWREAAEQIELLYGERWQRLHAAHRRPSAPTSCARPSAMRWATSRSGLARFREKYAAKMADTPDRRAFEVVSAPIGAGGAEFQDVAKTVAAVDTLDAFLRDMRARYPDRAPSRRRTPPRSRAQPAAANAAGGCADRRRRRHEQPRRMLRSSRRPASSPLPPKPPAGMPVKPDAAPTGSISSAALSGKIFVMRGAGVQARMTPKPFGRDARRRIYVP